MTERIGIVTGGGDCPGLNAVIRAVVKAASRRGWDSIGILGGYEGLLEPVRYRPLEQLTRDGWVRMADDEQSALIADATKPCEPLPAAASKDGQPARFDKI